METADALNVADFRRYPGISATHPRDVLASSP